MMKFYKTITLILTIAFIFSACLPSKSIARPVAGPDYWPTQNWQSSSPEQQGMDSAKLADMLEEINQNKTNIHSLLIIRNGYLITEVYFHPYTQDTKEHIQSVTKSVIGMLVGKAIGDGSIKSANEKLVSFYTNRTFSNTGAKKDSIRLKDLLSMSSGLDCQEFSGTGTTMEQSPDWVQFMLDLPVTTTPGQQFGYCNGNAHLLSAILEKTNHLNTRIYANQEIFQSLGIPFVSESDWGADPQGFSLGGFGLHLTPKDMAKLAFLYLHNGKWEDQQIIPAAWIAESTTQQIIKEDGSGYGYLWTVYPEDGHYAALGLGGQQIHVYPQKDLIVIVTAGLPAYAEAPEVENMLGEFILPAIQSENSLPENAAAFSRLQKAVEFAANPLQPIPSLPDIALNISQQVYKFEENPVGWQTLKFDFKPGANTAQLILNDSTPVQVGLDNLYRLSNTELFVDLLIRGSWTDKTTFVIDYPYAISGPIKLGELGATQISIKYSEDAIQTTIQPLIFGGEPIVFNGVKINN
jgi:CubicO group peptidase (beta-lactamase class C family)